MSSALTATCLLASSPSKPASEHTPASSRSLSRNIRPPLSATYVSPLFPQKTHTLCLADFRPVQRELVIDIDISDYDELRTCGSGGHICAKCWPFMAVAIQVGVWVCCCTTHAGIGTIGVREGYLA